MIQHLLPKKVDREKYEGLTACTSKLQVMTSINLSWMKPLPQEPSRHQVIIEEFKFSQELVQIDWQLSS